MVVKIGAVGLVTVLALLTMIGVFIVSRDAAQTAGQSAGATVQRMVAKGCDRNQIQRIYEIIDERYAIRGLKQAGIKRPVIAGHYIRLVNCKATYEDANNRNGNPVYLSKADEECLMQLVIDHRMPREQPTSDPISLRRMCSQD